MEESSPRLASVAALHKLKSEYDISLYGKSLELEVEPCAGNCVLIKYVANMPPPAEVEAIVKTLGITVPIPGAKKIISSRHVKFRWWHRLMKRDHHAMVMHSVIAMHERTRKKVEMFKNKRDLVDAVERSVKRPG